MMSKIKLGTLVVAFAYTIYHINTFGWRIGNSLILAFLLFAIAMDCYQMSKSKTQNQLSTRKTKKK